MSWTSSFSSRASISRRTFLAADSSSSSTVVFGSIVSSADSAVIPAASTASRTLPRDSGGAVTRQLSPSRSTSSAPPSAAASVSSSSSAEPSTSTTALRSKSHATDPDSPRLPSGSGPPSRAATMIARANLEKSCPRLASVAPFFRLIWAHLLCPATHRLLLPDHVEEEDVHPRVVGQLRMERRDEEPSLAEQDRLAVELGEHPDAPPRLGDARSADEHPTHRP